MKIFRYFILTLVCLIFSPPLFMFLLDTAFWIMTDKTFTGMDWSYKSDRVVVLMVWTFLAGCCIVPTWVWATNKYRP